MAWAVGWWKMSGGEKVEDQWNAGGEVEDHGGWEGVHGEGLCSGRSGLD